MKKKKKRIFKYATGAVIPKGAVYLGTVAQTQQVEDDGCLTKCWYVWHYFLVEVEEEV